MTDEALKKIIVTLIAVTVFFIWQFHETPVEGCTNSCPTDISAQRK
jgi:hypothetical protein